MEIIKANENDEVLNMKIIIQTKNKKIIWNYKKCIKNIAITGIIATYIVLYVNWFINYNNYIYSLMK